MTEEEVREIHFDTLERRRAAEEAFERAYEFRAFEEDWATIASEMGLTDFYRKLKGN